MPEHRLTSPRTLNYVALAMGALALFISLGGDSWAAKAVTAALKNNSVTSAAIRNNSVTSADIRNDTIASKDLSASLRAQLGKGGPTGPAGPQGAAGAAGAAGATGPAGPAGAAGPNGAAGPTGPKGDTGDTGPTGPKGADGNEIADGGITTNMLADGAVTTDKLGPNAVTSLKVVDGAIAAVDLRDDSVATAEVVDFGLSNQDIGVLFAEVTTDGTVAHSSGAVTASKVEGAVGQYTVDFGRNVASCTAVATIGPSGGGASAGEVNVADRSGVPTAVFVDTNDSTGASADRPFRLIVVC